jgi:hypothetical protein
VAKVLLGPHQADVDEELIVVRYHGAVTLEHVTALVALMDDVKRQHGVVLLLADLHRAGIMEPKARRYMADHAVAEAHHRWMFGFNPIVRILISMILRAMSLVGKRPPKIQFCSTEAEARQELEVVRSSVRESKAASPDQNKSNSPARD